MNHSKIASKSQADIQVLDQIDDFFDKFCEWCHYVGL